MSEAKLSPTAPLYLVTVLYNSEAHVASFTTSLLGQDFTNWQLIAVDNASVDASTSELLRMADARISLVSNPSNVGFAKGANQGIRSALAQGAEFIVLINNDTQIPSDFLSRFIEIRDELKADVIAPRIMLLHQPDEAWYAGGHLDYDWAFKNVHEQYDPHERRLVRTVDFASGCCLGLSRRVLSTVGLFDESFFVYWEDTDYCLRLLDAGIPIHYVSDPFILHEGGHASGGEHSVGFNKIFWRSYIQIVKKHFGIVAGLRTIMRLSLKELGRPNRQPAPLRAMLAAMMRGLVTPQVPMPALQSAWIAGVRSSPALANVIDIAEQRR